MKVCILGAGAWGLAIADLLSSNNCLVTVWEFDKIVCDSLEKERKLTSKLPGYTVPEAIKFTNDILSAVNDAEVIINAVPTQFIRSYFSKISKIDFSKKIIVNVSKGIEASTGKDIREMFITEFETVTDDNFVILAGPSFAIEVALYKTPTAVVAACKNIETEMIRFGTAMGGKRETFSGLSGIGDIILTCNSSLSRNWQVGNRLAKGEKLEEIIESMNMVAEGVETCRIVKKIAEEKNISMPIAFTVYELLFNGMSPRDGIAELMTREKKKED